MEVVFVSHSCLLSNEIELHIIEYLQRMLVRIPNMSMVYYKQRFFNNNLQQIRFGQYLSI